jgi:putative transposase
MTVVEWMPLFTNPDIVSLVLESLRFVQKEHQVILYAYVIMEHHLHLIASAPELGKTMKEFKSFTASLSLPKSFWEHNCKRSSTSQTG